MASPGLVPVWFGALIVAASPAWTTVRLDDIRVDRKHRTISLPGGPAILAASLAIFVVKYSLAVAAALLPEFRAVMAAADIAVSGLAAGYFLARLARILVHYRRAAVIDLGVGAAGQPQFADASRGSQQPDQHVRVR
jgi:hypothetical protein